MPLSVPLIGGDPYAQSYTVTVLAYNTSSGEYDVIYRGDGLQATDFPHEVDGGVPNGRHIVTQVEAVVDPERRRSLSFNSTSVQPLGT